MAEVEFTLTQGGLNTNGTFILNTDNFYKRSVVSSYVDVIGYKTLDISVDNRNVEIGHVAYYNSNKTFIKCDSYTNNGLQSLRVNITDPNVAFIIFDFSTFDESDITPDQVSVTVNLSGKRVTLEVGPNGFAYSGSLDTNATFTHMETYIPVAGNENATVTWGGIEGWLRYVFYDANKNFIGQYTGTAAQTSQSISNLIAKNANAVYIRISINQTVPGFYGLYLEGSEYDEEGPVLDGPVLDESIRNIKIGDITITKIYLGSENISKVYLGDILIFGGKEVDTPPDTPQEGEYASHEGYPIIVEDENIDITKDAYLVEMSGNGVTSGLVGSKVSDGYVITIMSTDISYEFGKGGRME